MSEFQPHWRLIKYGIVLNIIYYAAFIIVTQWIIPYPDYNDWLELVYLGTLNLVMGINPYGKEYTLGIALTTPRNFYTINVYFYGPFSLLAHLPAALFPVRLDGLGTADFMPSFTFMQIIFSFLVFWRLAKRNHQYIGLIFWANPFWVSFQIGSFFTLPILLCLLGLEQLEHPKWSIFWFGLSSITYHFTLPLLVFAIILHYRQIKPVILGLLPSLLILGAFSLWSALEGNPTQLVNDLLISQMNRPYMDWSVIQSVPITCMFGSIPPIFYNVLGFDIISLWTGGLIRMSTLMMLISLGVMGILCIKLLLNPSAKNALKYATLSIVLLFLSSPYGLIQYYTLVILPTVFLLEYTDQWQYFEDLGQRIEKRIKLG